MRQALLYLHVHLEHADGLFNGTETSVGRHLVEFGTLGGGQVTQARMRENGGRLMRGGGLRSEAREIAVRGQKY